MIQGKIQINTKPIRELENIRKEKNQAALLALWNLDMKNLKTININNKPVLSYFSRKTLISDGIDNRQ